METSRAARTRPAFSKMTGDSGIILFVMHQRADYPTSMKLLEEANLRPLTHQEALIILTKDEKLRELLKGKWFRLAGEGIGKTEVYMINSKGIPVKLRKNTSPENKARFWDGKMPISLFIVTDATIFNDWRYNVGAYLGPDIEAPLVVGVPKGLTLAQAQPGLRRSSAP